MASMARLTLHSGTSGARGCLVLSTIAEVASAYQLPVVAGESGLNRAIRWVLACELLDPGSEISGGELILTHGLALDPANGGRSADYAARLDQIGVAGVGFGIGPCHPAVPPELAQAADQRGLPVLVIEPTLPFTELTIAISSSLLRVQAAEARRVVDVQSALATAAVLGGRAQIVATLAEYLESWAVVVDRAGKPQHATGGARVHIDDALAAASGYRRRIRHPGIYVQPIGDVGPRAPQLVVGVRPGQESLARQLTRHAAYLLDLTARPAAVTNPVRYARHQAVDILLRPGEATTRATLERWSLPADDLVVTMLRSRSRMVFLEKLAATWAEELRLPVLLAGEGPTVTAILPEYALATWESRISTAAATESIPVRCGIGLPVPFNRLPESAAQARQALEIALADGQVLLRYADLPASRILLAGPGAREIAERALIGLLGQDDSLAESLHVFLAENGSWEAAAAQLGVHRHTLRRRIQRIEELTGRNLNSMEDRVELWVALRARGLSTGHLYRLDALASGFRLGIG